MKFCEKCRVYVPSTREHCPLCQGRLTQAQDNGQPHYDDEIFPYLPTIYHQHNLLIRIVLHLINLYKSLIRNTQISKLRSSCDNIHHTASLYCYLPAKTICSIDDLLHTVNI